MPEIGEPSPVHMASIMAGLELIPAIEQSASVAAAVEQTETKKGLFSRIFSWLFGWL